LAREGQRGNVAGLQCLLLLRQIPHQCLFLFQQPENGALRTRVLCAALQVCGPIDECA
jgi:hypothetical protein